MRYADIKNVDIANGPGCRVSLWVSGCKIKCPRCHNKEAQDFNYGKEFTDKTFCDIIELMDKPYIKGLSILGGEPLDQPNEVMCDILRDVKMILPHKSIWLYTGHIYEEDIEPYNPILDFVDVLVDGPFIEKQHVIDLRFRGSLNQRLIDIKETRKQGRVVEWS